MSANLSALLYLVASICFIMALRGLSSPESARGGNLFGIAVSPGRGLYFVDAYGGAPGLPADNNLMVAPLKDH